MPVDPPQQQADPSASAEQQSSTSVDSANLRPPGVQPDGAVGVTPVVAEQIIEGPMLPSDGNLAIAESPNERIAMVRGEPFTQLPLDLYIPPDALEVILDAFEGPLDLLLYLIKRQNLDILNIPIADITAQYMKYIGLMETMKFELAAEYLVMAAMLAEIKSRMLLPRVDEDNEDEDDPRAELIRRLQEYERIKTGAVTLDEMPRMEREHQQLKVVPPVIERDVPVPDVSMKELMQALRDVAERAERMGHHSISRETLSVRARMSDVLSVLKIGEFLEFSTLFNPEEGRLGVVVTFLAILELCKEAAIDIVQAEPFATIYLTPRSESTQPADEGEVGDVDKPEDAAEDAASDLQETL